MTDDTKIFEFRERIRKIKKRILDKIVYSTQDVQVLDTVISAFITYYKELRNALNAMDISPDLRKRMIYYLRRDLIMFPYTLDEERINMFSEETSMEKKPNDLI